MSEESYLRALARYSGDIRTGNISFNYRTGQCGPAQPTQLRSWGAGCPPGYCPPDRMPEALNRYFAGDRTGCRELPYCVNLTTTSSATLNIDVTREVNSKVTMCPTRVIAWSDSTINGFSAWLINEIRFGNQNQLVGGPVSAQMFDPGAFQDVPIVPDCLRAGMPFSISATLLAGGSPTVRNLYLVFIGPMIG